MSYNYINASSHEYVSDACSGEERPIWIYDLWFCNYNKLKLYTMIYMYKQFSFRSGTTDWRVSCVWYIYILLLRYTTDLAFLVTGSRVFIVIMQVKPNLSQHDQSLDGWLQHVTQSMASTYKLFFTIDKVEHPSIPRCLHVRVVCSTTGNRRSMIKKIERMNDFTLNWHVNTYFNLINTCIFKANSLFSTKVKIKSLIDAMIDIQ